MRFIAFSPLLFLFLGCNRPSDITNEFCPQELNLLRGKSPIKVDFDFALDNEGQLLESFRAQTGKRLCSKYEKLTARIGWNDQTTLEIPLLVDAYCDSIEGGVPMFLKNIISIYINKNSQILIEGKYLASLDSLATELEREVDSNKRKLHYSISWTSETSLNLKQVVFKAVVRSYLKAAHEKAQFIWQEELCELDSAQVERLSQENQFGLWFIVFPSLENLYDLHQIKQPKPLDIIEDFEFETSKNID